MTELVVEEDCGNAPKKQKLKEFYTELAAGDVEAILSRLTDDVRWTIVGEVSHDGKEAVEGYLEQILAAEYEEIHVDNIITHGYSGAANGTTTSSDGDMYGFCEVFTFDSPTNTADIEAIDSYVIETG